MYTLHHLTTCSLLAVVKSCLFMSSHGWNFETWPWWTHTSSAAVTHWLENCEHFRYSTAGLIGTKVVWQHTPSNSIFTSSNMFSMFHIMLTLGQLDHSWKRTLTSNDKEVNDKARHLQGAKARPYCKLPHLASTHIHTSLLSWTAAAGTSENAHKHVPAFDLSLVKQCVKIKLGSWVQPTALVHFELKLSLYVCQPKLDMQCIEILSRAMPRLLAVSNAMPPNRNMPAYLQNGKCFLSSWIETIPYRQGSEEIAVFLVRSNALVSENT